MVLFYFPSFLLNPFLYKTPFEESYINRIMFIERTDYIIKTDYFKTIRYVYDNVTADVIVPKLNTNIIRIRIWVSFSYDNKRYLYDELHIKSTNMKAVINFINEYMYPHLIYGIIYRFLLNRTLYQ